MATLNLPSWFDVAECEVTLQPEVRGFAGPFGGPTEVQDLLGDRWRMRLTLPDGDYTAGGRAEALFNRLRGGADWLRLHHFAKPAPRGTARGLLTLSGAVAQGANTLAIAGAMGANAILGGSFEVDSNADGLADGWARYSNGSTGALSASLSTTAVAAGAYSQQCVAASLGGTALDRNGVSRAGVQVGHLAGLTVTLHATVAGTAGSTMRLYAAWQNSSGTPTGGDIFGDLVATGGVQTITVTGLCPAAAATAEVYAYQLAGPGGACVFLVDGLRLVAGASAGSYPPPATLLAGDMLGHNGEQLFQVYEDATASDAGAITVSTVNRARKAIASGQAIVWDKPGLPFQLLDASGVPTAYTRGRVRGQQVEFVEAWQA